jgi:hypothetical protein
MPANSSDELFRFSHPGLTNTLSLSNGERDRMGGLVPICKIFSKGKLHRDSRRCRLEFPSLRFTLQP